MEYIRNPGFWFAVIVVALAANFAYNYLTKKGKLL